LIFDVSCYCTLFIHRTCCHFPPHTCWVQILWEADFRGRKMLTEIFFHDLKAIFFSTTWQWVETSVMIDIHNDFHAGCMKCFHAIPCSSFFLGDSSWIWYFGCGEMSIRNVFVGGMGLDRLYAQKEPWG